MALLWHELFLIKMMFFLILIQMMRGTFCLGFKYNLACSWLAQIYMENTGSISSLTDYFQMALDYVYTALQFIELLSAQT